MPSGLPQAIVAPVRQLDCKEDTMRTNHRTAPALTAPWLIAAAAALAALAAAAFLLNAPKTEAAGTAGTVVSTAKTSLGRILVNSRGHTLYLFARDTNGKSHCTGMCATFWPPLIASGKPRAASGVKASLLGTTRRADGRRQVTYNHHPLYTFVKDKRTGQTNGEGLNAFGAKWYAVSPAGAKVVRKVAPPAGNGIPQNNGGDHDSDNNGGPSDGDGNI
jgi:predicted lipoprotein with Yx(FWY)xxD motif